MDMDDDAYRDEQRQARGDRDSLETSDDDSAVTVPSQKSRFFYAATRERSRERDETRRDEIIEESSESNLGSCVPGGTVQDDDTNREGVLSEYS